MADVKIEALGPVEPNSFNGLTKVQFMNNGQVVYMFCKPGNEPKEGETLDGDITPDKAGKLKFTKTKNAQWAAGGTPQRYEGPKKGGGFNRDDNAIKAQWAIGQAVQLELAVRPKGVTSMENIESEAKQLYAMISRVKDSDTVTQTEIQTDSKEVFSDGRPVPTDATSELSTDEIADFFNQGDK